MAREILFKAKRTDNGEWVEGSLLIDEAGNCYMGVYVFPRQDTDIVVCGRSIGKTHRRFHGIGFTQVESNTICQYTGLTDKNENKIWENDVIKYHFGEEVAPIRFGEYQSCFDSTKTAHIGFYVDWNNNKALRKDLGYWVNMIDCEVIGNIFDNPELLGGGE